MSDDDDFRHGQLWQNFNNVERQDNARKIRKLSVDRFNLIEESMSTRSRPRRRVTVQIHRDWRLFDACVTGDEQVGTIFHKSILLLNFGFLYY